MPTIRVQKAISIINIINRSDNDFIIGISGARGLGKSTLMVNFTKEITGGWYDFSDKHVYDRKEFEDKLKNLPDDSVICCDEVITSLFKREWHQNKQIEVVKLLNMYRDKRHIIFLLIPHFWDLDGAVRNSLIIKWWIHVYKLGEAIVFKADDNPFSIDPWNTRHNLYLWRKGQIYKSPNYLFNIYWPELEYNKYQEYKKVKAIKRRAASEAEKAEAKEPEISKTEMIVSLKKLNPGITGHKIAQALGIGSSYVYRIFNERGLAE